MFAACVLSLSVFILVSMVHHALIIGTYCHVTGNSSHASAVGFYEHGTSAAGIRSLPSLRVRKVVDVHDS